MPAPSWCRCPRRHRSWPPPARRGRGSAAATPGRAPPSTRTGRAPSKGRRGHRGRSRARSSSRSPPWRTGAWPHRAPPHATPAHPAVVRGGWPSSLVKPSADSIISMHVEILAAPRYAHRVRHSTSGEKAGTAMTTESLPRHTHHALPAHEPPAALRATGIVVALTTVLAIIAIAFALPAARSKPHDVPIGAVGPPSAGGAG